MIINKNSKIVIEIDGKPNENWTGDNENYFFVDSNSDLAAKIRENAPFFDFVLDDNGNLIDVTSTERPPEPEPEPSQDEINLDFDHRITCLELGI